ECPTLGGRERHTSALVSMVYRPYRRYIESVEWQHDRVHLCRSQCDDVLLGPRHGTVCPVRQQRDGDRYREAVVAPPRCAALISVPLPGPEGVIRFRPRARRAACRTGASDGPKSDQGEESMLVSRRLILSALVVVACAPSLLAAPVGLPLTVTKSFQP